MTLQTIDEVEERFLLLRKDYIAEQWKSPSVLVEKIDQLMDYDVPLAYRLMQRVKNLDPSSANRNKLSEIKKVLLAKHPELLSSSSNKSRTSRALSRVERTLANSKEKVSATNLSQLFKPIFVFVVLPFFIFAFYQIILASERFESRSQLILKQPDGVATLDPTMALLSGFGGTNFSNDNELLKAYILSWDMVHYLENNLSIKEHFANKESDFFSRLSNNATREDLHEFFAQHVTIEIDDKSSVVSILAQGFTPEFVEKLTGAIVERAEWYINEIGHNLAKEQLLFVQNEHQLAESRLENAKKVLLAFQRENDLLDPEAEGMALQKITYAIESEIAVSEAALNTLRSGMSESAPLVMRARAELESLNQQLVEQRRRLTNGKNSDDNSVSEILAKFTDLKIDLELALQAYSSSQISLEKSRIEAYRQLKYLVVVESPTLPEESKYPKVTYNLTLFLAVTLMLFLIGRIVAATVNELR